MQNYKHRKVWYLIINVTKEQAAWLRDHGVHVITLNRQRPSRHKKWLATYDKTTASELKRFEKKRALSAEVSRAR